MRNALLALLLITPQDEKTVAQAVKDTLAKESFTLRITPVADLKDVLPADRAGIVGVPVLAEQAKGGVYRVTDGTTEIAGRGPHALIKTKEGWRAANDVTSEMITEVTEAYGKDEGSRKNVSQAKATYRRLLAIVQLAGRSMPPTAQVSRAETDFKNLKKGATEVIDGKRCQIYEGDMKEAAATVLLRGPYEQMVKDGSLVISEVTGRGRVWIAPDGIMRRTEFKAAGRYTVVNKDENTKKTVPVAISVTTEIVKAGETAPAVTPEIEDKLKLMEIEAQEKKE